MIFDLIIVIIIAVVLITFSLIEPIHDYCKRVVDKEAHNARKNKKISG